VLPELHLQVVADEMELGADLPPAAGPGGSCLACRNELVSLLRELVQEAVAANASRFELPAAATATTGSCNATGSTASGAACAGSGGADGALAGAGSGSRRNSFNRKPGHTRKNSGGSMDGVFPLLLEDLAAEYDCEAELQVCLYDMCVDAADVCVLALCVRLMVSVDLCESVFFKSHSPTQSHTHTNSLTRLCTQHTHTHTHARRDTKTNTNTITCTHTHTRTHTHTHARRDTKTNTNTITCTHSHARTHTHTHTHKVPSRKDLASEYGGAEVGFYVLVSCLTRRNRERGG